MGRFEDIADRFEIEALRGEFTDALAMKDYDRFASLFTKDAEVRIPGTPFDFTGRSAIRAGVERAQGAWEFFVQTVHPGSTTVDGDTATGRTYIGELGRFHDGGSHQNYAIYHDRYRRTEDGWRFSERIYEVRYIDTTPLPGKAGPQAIEMPADPANGAA